MGKNLWNRERVSGLTWDCRTTPSPSVEWWAVVVWSRWLRRATPGRARGVPTLPTFILRVIKRVLKKQHPDLDPTVRLDIECDQKVLRSQVTIRTLDLSEFYLLVVTREIWRHFRDPQDCAVPSLAFVLCWTHQKGSPSQPSYLEVKTNF